VSRWIFSCLAIVRVPASSVAHAKTFCEPRVSTHCRHIVCKTFFGNWCRSSVVCRCFSAFSNFVTAAVRTFYCLLL
jgi:hypothetical protein